MYISNKTKDFSYKGGCGICGHTCIEEFKRKAGLGERLMALSISNTMLFKTVIHMHTTKELKYKAVLGLKHYCSVAMWHLRSNIF